MQIQWILQVLENKWRKNKGTRKIWPAGRSACRTLSPTTDILSFLAPEGRRKSTIGGEPRGGEHRLSRTRVWVDRVVTVDEMSELFFACLFPPFLA
jgi:hypothetical protein